MLLLLTACARLHDVGAPPPAAPGEAALSDGPVALAGAPAAPPVGPPPVGPPPVAVIDEAGLSALLRNDGPAPLVVNFWATWCGPCVREMAIFDAVAAAHPDARFALVSVDERRDRPRLPAFLAKHGVRLPVYHLDADDPARSLGRVVPEWPDLIPVTLVVEPGGAVRARFFGETDAERLGEALAD